MVSTNISSVSIFYEPGIIFFLTFNVVSAFIRSTITRKLSQEKILTFLDTFWTCNSTSYFVLSRW